MFKVILIILFGLIVCPAHFSQQKIFGYKISGNGDIISDVFRIQDGFILDSVRTYNQTYRFEYNNVGKLKRDINFNLYTDYTNDGRMLIISGCRDYFYNSRGDIDSIAYGEWNDSIQTYNYTGGGRFVYSYDSEGKLLLKTYSSNGVIFTAEEDIYDTNGNLTLSKLKGYGSDTIYNIRNYDSENRLILTKSIQVNSPSYKQQIYKYDSSGNINCTTQTISIIYDNITNEWNDYLSFNKSGKIVKEILSNHFNFTDSTWLPDQEILYDYDEYGKILKIGVTSRFHYNADGNLDSLENNNIYSSGGYLYNKATLIDSYGNIIILPDYSGYCYFYYSKIITGIKRGKLNNKTFTLSQNYPNPFNPTTTITYSIPKSSFVTLKIYDLLGREITTLVNEEKHSGIHKVTWNAQNIPSGVYFYMITAGEYSKVNKMILLK